MDKSIGGASQLLAIPRLKPWAKLKPYANLKPWAEGSHIGFNILDILSFFALNSFSATALLTFVK
jgi:hypothetical protein